MHRPSGLKSRRPTGRRRAPSRQWRVGRRAGDASGRQLRVVAGVEKAKGEAALRRAVRGLGEEATHRDTQSLRADGYLWAKIGGSPEPTRTTPWLRPCVRCYELQKS
ncbi:hypothetical protein E2562_034766 [Oryza meyeriana var. granulata]|uniref:Uncharacterized protein n=1 Tax=Oryza meyeriana var. granulata TaxID=110450 RepID=A0A6G1CKN3_9ORYZ|nr:hypothetical protein E2562_034766 [Oryza meyeriana var. granulata]